MLMRLLIAMIAAAAAMSAGGCTPISLTFTFGARDRQLREATVLEDPGAGWFAPKVALIDVRGVMSEVPPNRFLGLTGGASPVDEFIARLRQAEGDGRVRAVILRINSPGGTVTSSDVMYRELRRFREQTGKPVIASLGEVAASGGYYLALGADEIVAQPTSITGSIGVIIPSFNASEGLRRIGVVSRAVRSGPNKDIANPLEPMRDYQYAILQAMVDEFHESFRDLVVLRRGGEVGPLPQGAGPRLDLSRVSELTDGRIMTGSEAVRSGLADREGDLRDSFERAKELAGVPHAKLVKYHDRAEGRPQTPYAAAGELSASTPGQPGGVVNLVNIDLGSLIGAGAGMNAYYLWLPELP